MQELVKIWVMILFCIICAVLAVQLASSVVAVILGSKTCKKDDRSRYLGRALIILGIRIFISTLSGQPATMLKARLMTAKTVSLINYGTVFITIISFALGAAVIVLFCMYFISNYQKGKKHLAASLILKVISSAVATASNYALGNYYTSKWPMYVFLGLRFLSVMLYAASMIVLIALCLSAAKKDNRKAMFVFPLLITVYSVIYSMLAMFANIGSMNNGRTEILMIVMPVAFSVITIVASIYVHKTCIIESGNETLKEN